MKMKTFKYFLITLCSLIIFNSNAQNLTFGCTDTTAANYDPNADQPLEGLVEASSCNFIWFQNYVGINEAFYNNYSSEFSVGTKITFAGQEYCPRRFCPHHRCRWQPLPRRRTRRPRPMPRACRLVRLQERCRTHPQSSDPRHPRSRQSCGPRRAFDPPSARSFRKTPLCLWSPSACMPRWRLI